MTRRSWRHNTINWYKLSKANINLAWIEKKYHSPSYIFQNLLGTVCTECINRKAVWHLSMHISVSCRRLQNWPSLIMSMLLPSTVTRPLYFRDIPEVISGLKPNGNSSYLVRPAMVNYSNIKCTKKLEQNYAQYMRLQGTLHLPYQFQADICNSYTVIMVALYIYK